MIGNRRPFRESGSIYDPGSIRAQLGGLSAGQSDLLMKLYRASRAGLSVQQRAMQQELVGLFQGAADDIEQDIGRTFAKLGTDQWSLASARRIAQDKVLFAQIEDRVHSLGGALQHSFDTNLTNGYKEAYLDAGYRLDVLTPGSINIKFGLLPDQMIVQMVNETWSGGRFSDRLGIINSEMVSNIKHSLLRSMMAEESWADAARRIRGQMGVSGQKSVWRAEMVARTEMSHVAELAAEQIRTDNEDVIDDSIWVAHPGACPEVCLPNHAQPISEVGSPPNDSHPNCECGTMDVPKSWQGLAQKGDGDFSISPASRQSWAEAHGVAVED